MGSLPLVKQHSNHLILIPNRSSQSMLDFFNRLSPLNSFSNPVLLHSSLIIPSQIFNLNFSIQIHLFKLWLHRSRPLHSHLPHHLICILPIRIINLMQKDHIQRPQLRQKIHIPLLIQGLQCFIRVKLRHAHITHPFKTRMQILSSVLTLVQVDVRIVLTDLQLFVFQGEFRFCAGDVALRVALMRVFEVLAFSRKIDEFHLLFHVHENWDQYARNWANDEKFESDGDEARDNHEWGKEFWHGEVGEHEKAKKEKH